MTIARTRFSTAAAPLLLLVLVLLAPAATGHARLIIDGAEVAAGGSTTSSKIDLVNSEGYFSVQVAVSGSGTAKIEYLLSNNDVTYLEPTGAVDIASGLTAASGPGSDGHDLYSFSPPHARWLKIRVTETGASDAVTVSVWLHALDRR